MKKKVLYISLTSTIVICLFVLYSVYKFNLVPEVSIKETLESLPYLAWVPAGDSIDKAGVTKYDKDKAFKGINIYTSKNLPVIQLLDMEGNVLHAWSIEPLKNDHLHSVEVCENGDLFAVVRDRVLVKVDWNSQPRWAKRLRFHHEVRIAEDGDIYSLIRKGRVIFRRALPFPILDDYVVIMSPDGKINKKISIYNVFKKEIPFKKFTKIYKWLLKPANMKKVAECKRVKKFFLKNDTPFDIFHTNTVEIIDRDIKGLCKKGDLLVSMRELDLIGIIDIEKEEPIWKWGPGILDRQHHPTLLENGNILIFDNGYYRGYSRVIELDPVTSGGEIVWEYKADPPETFFSKRNGASQKLPNGNVLVTEGSRGRVFEITPDGEIVWEFYNPQMKKDESKRAAIYRFMRITDPGNYSCLKNI